MKDIYIRLISKESNIYGDKLLELMNYYRVDNLAELNGKYIGIGKLILIIKYKFDLSN